MSYRNDRYAATAVLTASTTLRAGIVHPYDTSGGAIAQTLPDAATFGASNGLYVLLQTGGNALAVSPAGADTINGLAQSLTLTESGEAIFLVRDAVATNWLLLGRVGASADPRFTPVNGPASPYDASFGEYINLTTAPFTVNLPAIGNNAGRGLIIKMAADDTDLVTVTPSGGETIEGASSFTFSSERGSVWLIPNNGTNWGVN